MNVKVCEDLRTVAAVAVNLSITSIRYVEDLWEENKIKFILDPTPQSLGEPYLKEIVFQSILFYLKRPGHVLLQDGMISPSDIDKEHDNPLLRVRKFWEYWHGSTTLTHEKTRTVSAEISPWKHHPT